MWGHEEGTDRITHRVLIFATDRETSRHRWLPVFATGEWGVATAADWPTLVDRLVQPSTGLVVVDPELAGLRAALLVELASSLPHRPLLRTIETPLPGIPLIPSRPSALQALLHRRLAPVARDELVSRLTLSGLGADAGRLVSSAAGATGPLVVQGARGTGKEQHARLVHALSGARGAFVVVDTAAPWRPDGAVGTMYFESAHHIPDLRDRVRDAERSGCRVMLGTRQPLQLPGAVVLRLTPLHERPECIAPLTQHFLGLHARRLGVPRRRFDRKLLALLQAWSWPANERELDRFVHDVLAAVDMPLVRAEHLPAELRARLDPEAPVPGADIEGYEETVAGRLAPVVQGWYAGGGTDLHAMVVDATERVLLRLVLGRTQGNRKAAARLLGLARNTLQARLERLGVSASAPE